MPPQCSAVLISHRQSADTARKARLMREVQRKATRRRKMSAFHLAHVLLIGFHMSAPRSVYLADCPVVGEGCRRRERELRLYLM